MAAPETLLILCLALCAGGAGVACAAPAALQRTAFVAFVGAECLVAIALGVGVLASGSPLACRSGRSPPSADWSWCSIRSPRCSWWSPRSCS